jgi:hypothetical protein
LEPDEGPLSVVNGWPINIQDGARGEARSAGFSGWRICSRQPLHLGSSACSINIRLGSWHEYVSLQGIFGFHQYQVVGRHLPTEADPNPTVYRMKVWAPDAVRAKSKFW